MKVGFGRLLTRIGNWVVDFWSTIRAIGQATAYARSHPTDLQTYDDK